ncbi:unnamed protein product [Peniophora sp. CBMAI 1063]|nr:unnamed protein product [Peniophora sp. CBMAI 1063]
MSLLSDPDFLIHSLRLNYLRNVDDPYGQRLISFSPFYASNPYVAAAHLSDTDRWPELHASSSPSISDDEADPAASNNNHRRRSGFPGATGLKYSATIMPGTRQSGLGMSVRGRRPDLTGKRLSRISKRGSTGSTPNSPTVIPASENTPEPTGVNITSASPLDTAQKEPEVVVAPPPPAPAPVVPGFVPKFKGAAEMDARRRLRLQARQGAVAAAAAPRVTPDPNRSLVDFDSSSSEEESTADFEEDGFDDVGVDGDSDMEGDDGDEEFDPEFVNMLGVTDDSVDGLSSVSMSNSGLNSISMSNPSHLAAPASVRGRSKLSPVREKHGHDFSLVENSLGAGGSGEPMFEMVTPPPKQPSNEPAARPTKRRPSQPPAPDDLFARQKVVVAPVKKSALSMRLSEGTDLNPFSELYSAISGRGASASTNVTVFFPQSKTPMKAMNLVVRKDATVEEVLGFALWTYWEEKWEPRLDEGDDTPEEKLSAVGWVLRIAEEDGEVDEDFPPPDRMGKISKFNFDAYAVLAASATQMQQNKIFEAKIQRSPSRVVKAKRPEPTPLLGVPGASSNAGMSSSGAPSTSAMVPSTFPSHPGSVFGSFNPSSSFGPQIFLRIRVQDTLDAVHVYSTIHVTSTMYLQEALDIVCHRRKLLPAKDYTFVVSDMSVMVALDRTVASLQGKTDLLLVKKEMVPNLGVNVAKPAGSSADPNSSIFGGKANAQPEPEVTSVPDFAADYKRYTVYRKMPMLVGRHERILAIDGLYVHFMPSNKAKAVFESGKTSSHHIKSVVAAQQSHKDSSTFRIVVHRLRENGGNKRYDFEASSAADAAEIVQTIKSMKNSIDRQSTIKARRSKHMG